jgi:hypothetical protein
VTLPLARQQGAGPQLGSGSLEVGDKPVGLRRSPDPVQQSAIGCPRSTPSAFSSALAA